jgi:hypothetical protein
LRKKISHANLKLIMDGEPIKGSTEIDADMSSFRQLALDVSQDLALGDPFSDGIDEGTPTESRDALKAILTKHFGYADKEIGDVGDDSCQFTGRKGDSVKITTGADEHGETYLDFTAGVSETRRLMSPSLKLGVPIVFALAHQTPEKLARIYDRITKAPHVLDFCKIETTQALIVGPGTKTSTFILQDSGFRQYNSYTEI